ncbi:divergent polysaccharide deacetylase family protein [Roseovarius aestuarii]|uniref:Divergent polysaccharide deacetylase n=1 Tax=Roseovarius aestuarii TaxID=475083 RepID=A0A1X7BQ60_9RHOB|nr:divergent polysaccharide deacetylase family protein [Roseovarius aestuarii]SMC11737.1 Divergent polysaccharide deacetylase [Roseovarius aestuarii]
MARGTLSGMIAGIVVSGLAVGTASVLTEIPGTGAPEAVAIEVPAGSEFDQSRDDTQADLPDVQETPDAGDVARIEAPEPDDLSAIGSDDRASAAQPETDDTEVALNTPATGESGTGIAVETDTPILPNPQANAPEAPLSEEELSISTDPAQPAQPDIAEEAPSFTEEAADADDTDAATEENTASVDVQDQVADLSLPVVEPPEEAADAPESDTAPTPEVEDAAQTEGDTNSGIIEDIATNVTTDRLPSVSDAPEETAVEGETEDGAAAEADDATLPPIQRFAAEFENPDNKPLMSIVLIDDGSSPIDLDALTSFPYTLNFAVDTGWSGATDAMRKYRDAGFEVLAIIDLPEGASAADIEVSMQSYLTRVPEAVAIMEGQGRGLQSSRDASEQLADILLDSGHGAVMFANGLNTAQKLVARAGVPSVSVFRDFDAKGQSATVIRRFLDQAAFRAGQEEQGVVMVGRLRADTISALLLWGLQDRAGRVAIAPVSAVLLAE